MLSKADSLALWVWETPLSVGPTEGYLSWSTNHQQCERRTSDNCWLKNFPRRNQGIHVIIEFKQSNQFRWSLKSIFIEKLEFVDFKVAWCKSHQLWPTTDSARSITFWLKTNDKCNEKNKHWRSQLEMGVIIEAAAVTFLFLIENHCCLWRTNCRLFTHFQW